MTATATKSLPESSDVTSRASEKAKNNLKLWDAVCVTDPKMTKNVKYGKREFTAVDPQWQLMQATKLWGSYGTDWGLEDLKFEIVTLQVVTSREGEDEKGKYKNTEHVTEQVLTLNALFRYPGGIFPIANDMKYRPGDEAFKKLQTNTRSKALSMLGFSADVYMGKFDDQDYIKDLKVKYDEFEALKVKVLSTIKTARTERELSGCESRLLEMVASDTITGDQCNDFLVEIKKRRAELEANKEK